MKSQIPAAADGAADTAATTATPDATTFESALAADLGETEAQEDEQPADAAAEDDDDYAASDDPDEGDSAADDESGEDDSDDGEEDADDADADDDAADDEDDDEEPAEDNPRAWEQLPKWTRERLSRQSAQLRDLKAQVAKIVTVSPTPSAPLADVETPEQLEQKLSVARSIRDWVKANPYGGTLYNGSQPVEISEETAQAKLAAAEALIDAAPDVQRRLAVRAATKPHEQAEAICPGMFKAGTEENKFAAEALRRCPELKTRMDNWEMFLAAAVRGLTQAAEEAQGVRYVRVTPKKSAAPAQSKPSSKKAPPVLKQSAPQAKSGRKPDIDQLRERAAATRDPADLSRLLAAEMAA